MSYIFISGGASSGKSDFALKYLKGRSDVTFIATGVSTDSEMEMRIRRHKNQRPSAWTTIEEPVDLIKAFGNIKNRRAAIILDCLTFWVSNLIYSKKLERDKILELAEKTAHYLVTIEKTALVVTNELGMGIIPENEEVRNYRKIAGEVNRIFARMSDEAYFIISGIGVKIK